MKERKLGAERESTWLSKLRLSGETREKAQGIKKREK
jgi:hypothetical protein